MRPTNAANLLIALLLWSVAAQGDAVYTDNAKFIGKISTLTLDRVTMLQACRADSPRLFRWEELAYVVFDSNCTPNGAPGQGYGRGEKDVTCHDRSRFFRIDFDHASDEPFVYAVSVELSAEALKVTTAAGQIRTGPARRARSIQPVFKCSSDPILKKGSFPREYQ